MTGNQLLSTGILNTLFNSLNIRDKEKVYWQNKIASYIADKFNAMLQQNNKIEDPAVEYLENLRSDLLKLRRVKTHRNLADPVINLVEIKIRVCERYIKLFRKKPHKRYHIDLFLITVFNFLWVLKYEERINILGNLYSLFKAPPDSYKDLISSDSDEKFPTTVQKRIYRISRNLADKHISLEPKFYKIPLLTIKKLHRIYGLSKKDIIFTNGLKGIIKRDDFLPSNLFKEHQQRRSREKYIETQIEKYNKAFGTLNLSNLRYVVKELGIPDRQKAFHLIVEDPEFVKAFQLSHLTK